MQLQQSRLYPQILNLDLDHLWTSDDCHTFLWNLKGKFYINENSKFIIKYGST